MKQATLSLLVALALLALANAVDVKAAQDTAKMAVPPVPVAAEPAKAALLGTESANRTASLKSRLLMISGSARHSIWINATEVIAAIVPIVANETAGSAPMTVDMEATRIPDEHAKSVAHSVFDKVMQVLQKYQAINIETPKSFASSPVFAPNVTAFKQLLSHQQQKFEKQRRLMAERWGRTRLLQGHPISMIPRMQRRPFSDVSAGQAAPPVPPSPPAKPEEKKSEEKKVEEGKKVEAKSDVKAEEAKKLQEIKELPLPDPKTLMNFKGFRFYQPLSFVIPNTKLAELTHDLRAVNTTIIGIKPFIAPNILEDARRTVVAEATQRALAVADSALNAAGVKRLGIQNIVVRSTPNPNFPMRMATNFITPQQFTVQGNVLLSVTF